MPNPKTLHGPFMSTVDDAVEGVKAIPDNTARAVEGAAVFADFVRREPPRESQEADRTSILL